MLFRGDHTRQPKVALGGRGSGSNESREEALERIRRERQRRKQQKVEHASAVVIQATWRRVLSQKLAKSLVRTQWMNKYGEDGSGWPMPAVGVFSPNNPMLREVLYFLDPRDLRDVELLARLCLYLFDNAPQGPLGFMENCPQGYMGMRALLRVQRLFSLIIEALFLHASTFAPQLQASLSSHSDEKISPLPSILMRSAMSLTSTDLWKQAAVGKVLVLPVQMKVTEILASILGSCPHLFDKVGRLLMRATALEDACRKQKTPSAAETVCTTLVVRYLECVKDLAHKTSKKNLSSPSSLYYLPCLPSRCPSLAPLFPRLWTLVVKELAVEWSKTGRLLPASSPSSNGTLSGISAVSLLGNLTSTAPAALKLLTAGAAAPPPPAAAAAAIDYVCIATALLSYVKPWLDSSLFLAGTSVGGHGDGNQDGEEDDGDDEDGGGYPRVSSSWSALSDEVASPVDIGMPLPSTPIPTQILDQICLLASPDLLCSLTTAILPSSKMDDTIPPVNEGHELASLVALIFGISRLRGRAVLVLAMNADFVRRYWFSYLKTYLGNTFGDGIGLVTGGERGFGCSDHQGGWRLSLAVFAEVMTCAVQVGGDRGLYDQSRPVAVQELYSVQTTQDHKSVEVGIVPVLRKALWNLLWVQGVSNVVSNRASISCGRLLSLLHDRNGRRPFAPDSAFSAAGQLPERFHAEIAFSIASSLLDGEDGGPEASKSSKSWALLTRSPCLVPFVDRVRVFYRIIAEQRARYESSTHQHEFGLGGYMGDMFGGSRTFFKVQRGHVLEDAMASMNDAQDLKGRVRILFVNELGMEEAGIDGGGLFKEFLESIIKEGFDPARRLFLTATDGRLYPNPHAAQEAPNGLEALEFLGKMVGKALWEGILLELPLAPFFLKHIRGAACDVDDLPLLDGQLAKSLESLRSYSGDVFNSLGLTFSVTDQVAGRVEEIDLVPGGRYIGVNAANWPSFVRRLAHFRLNEQLRQPVAAFRKGLESLIPRSWLVFFNDSELQSLISGAEQRGIDVGDMQRHVTYANGYAAEHPVIIDFWKALESFTPSQQAAFLRFVTSCSRPPLLGFSALYPPLCIQLAPDEGRLPTAATCMNLLKLPPYGGGVNQMRERLLYAIEAGAGFELS